jgi:putative membrane protein
MRILEIVRSRATRDVGASHWGSWTIPPWSQSSLQLTRQTSKLEVRDFGAMLVGDHAAVRQQGRDPGAKLGVTPTPSADDKDAKDLAAAVTQLRTLRGAEFDHAFLRHEVAVQKAVIDAVTSTVLPAIQNAEVKALVVKVAPLFRAQMLAADNLDKKLGVK